jgi:Domain of unknown function (DUF4157)
LLGRDLSDVRIHADGRAADNARRLQAQAFVIGSDISFAPGRFAPATARGRWLLAHELAHVAQPQRAMSAGELELASSESTAEHEAHTIASDLALGRRARPAHTRRAGAVHRFGEPENVPNLTYISSQGDPAFLDQAFAYHTLWGLAPKRVKSVEEVLTDLATRQGHLDRVRIVMHAAEQGIFSSLFTDEPRFSLGKERLSAYAQSDATGLAGDLGKQFNLGAGILDSVVSDVRTRKAALLKPFGIDQSGGATGALAELVDRAAQKFLLRAARTKNNASAVDTMTTSTDLILAELRARVAQQGNITAAEAQTLQSELETSMGNVGLSSPTGLNMPSDDDLKRLKQANRALTGGFRATLNSARSRFDATSTIDIRGCNAGKDLDYLRAFSQFFGLPGALPHVTAPNWFQAFLRLGFQQLVSAGDIATHMGDAEFEAALKLWFDVLAAPTRDALLTFYRYEISRRTQPAQPPAQPGSAGSSSAPPSMPQPQALPRLAGPSGTPMPAEDKTAVSLLSAPDKLPSPPTAPPKPPARQPGGSGSPQPLTDPLVDVAQRAVARLTAPGADARFYFDSALVLPVQNKTDLRLFALKSLQAEAMRNWVLNQWKTPAPGLQAVLTGTLNNQLFVQAVVESHEPDAQLFFPPDPRYKQHIQQI